MIINQDIILKQVYPVGSIYMSVNSTNPNTLFGGTWVQLKDRFLLGAGSTYSNGATGGEASVKLKFTDYQFQVYNTDSSNPDNDISTMWMPSGNNFGLGSVWTSNKNTAHNNMPPYLVVYMWKRTA